MKARLSDLVTNIVPTDGQQPKALARLGLINYINSLPFVLPIIDGRIQMPAQTFFGEPAELNSLYASGHLDLGAMSAFSFLQQKTLKLMPGISIASQNSVGSVLFFIKKDTRTHQPLRIAVSTASASAVNLLLVLLLEQGYEMPVLIPCRRPNLSESTVDAALIIGDQALIVDKLWSNQYERIDLGQWWQETFNLPAVFGVFAARKEWHQDNNSHIFKDVNETLIESAKYGLNEYFDKVLTQAEKVTALSKSRLIKYFKEELDYGLGSGHLLSLDKYDSLCRKHELFK